MLKLSILFAALISSSAIAAEKSWMIENFEALNVGGSHDVVVTTGEAQRVVASGAQDALDALSVRVDDGTLKIGTRSSGASWVPWSDRNSSLKIQVTVPLLTSARLSGDGDLEINMMKGDSVSLAVSGSGDMSVGRIEAEDVKLSIAGSGDMIVSGSCRNGDFSIAGSGKMDASRLACRTLETSISGSGSIFSNATGTAKVRIAGSGDTTVAGGAKCETRVAGSGRVDCR